MCRYRGEGFVVSFHQIRFMMFEAMHSTVWIRSFHLSQPFNISYFLLISYHFQFSSRRMTVFLNDVTTRSVRDKGSRSGLKEPCKIWPPSLPTYPPFKLPPSLTFLFSSHSSLLSIIITLAHFPTPFISFSFSSTSFSLFLSVPTHFSPLRFFLIISLFLLYSIIT